MATPDLIDQLILSVMNANTSEVLRANILGMILQCIILGLIITLVPRYIEMYFHSDPFRYKAFVIVGSILCTIQIGLTAWQTLNLIHVQGTPTATFHSILNCNNRLQETVILFVAVFNGFGCAYFCRRAWVLLGRRRWILYPGLVAILSSVVLEVYVGIAGFRMPEIRSVLDLPAVQTWWQKQSNLGTPWAGLAACVDVGICLSTIFALWYSKEQLATEAGKSFTRRIMIITVESMIVPVCIYIALFAMFLSEGATMMHYDITLLWILGPCIFVSVLFSLLSRQTIIKANAPPPTIDHKSQHASSTLCNPSSSSAIGLGSQHSATSPTSPKAGVVTFRDDKGLPFDGTVDLSAIGLVGGQAKMTGDFAVPVAITRTVEVKEEVRDNGAYEMRDL